ncbi:hypothetical protein Dimus_006809 [Dionaea muscipula]
MGNKNASQEAARNPCTITTKATVVNGVIITLYVESTSRSCRGGADPGHAKKKKKSTTSSKPLQIKMITRPSSCGPYDRRAQLLAYSHELRNSVPQEPTISNSIQLCGEFGRDGNGRFR